MTLDPTRFRALTFDCYGTLVDWESGILSALRPLALAHDVRASDEELLVLHGELESEAEAGPYRSYKEILREVVRGLGAKLGFTPSPAEIDSLPASLASWEPFPDTVAALGRLATRYRLVVVSNVDRDLFEATRAKLGPEIADVVTAEDAHAYKPNAAVFEHALARIDLPRDHVLHVAQSLFHDVAPARALGLSTVWVNRRHASPGFGATPRSDARPDVEVDDLDGLCRLLGV